MITTTQLFSSSCMRNTVEVFGFPQSGKSTLALQLCVFHGVEKCLYIQAEESIHSFMLPHVDLRNLWTIHSTCPSTILSAISHHTSHKAQIDTIVFDSSTTLPQTLTKDMMCLFGALKSLSRCVLLIVSQVRFSPKLKQYVSSCPLLWKRQIENRVYLKALNTGRDVQEGYEVFMEVRKGKMKGYKNRLTYTLEGGFK